MKTVSALVAVLLLSACASGMQATFGGIGVSSESVELQALPTPIPKTTRFVVLPSSDLSTGVAEKLEEAGFPTTTPNQISGALDHTLMMGLARGLTESDKIRLVKAALSKSGADLAVYTSSVPQEFTLNPLNFEADVELSMYDATGKAVFRKTAVLEFGKSDYGGGGSERGKVLMAGALRDLGN